MQNQFTDQKGFTLLEVAIVILVLGIILATLYSTLLTYIERTEIAEARSKLEEIDSALQTYLSLNGRYPCAAPLNAPRDTATFGAETNPGTCRSNGPGAGTTRVTSTNGLTVRIGAVPTRTLNLPDDYMMDAWGNRFTYAVTERLAETDEYDRDFGGITLRDSNDNSVIVNPDGTPGFAHYFIVSHGKSAAGATSAAGGGANVCTAGTLDEENCDNADAIFRDTLLTGTGAVADFYDDLVLRNISNFVNIPPGAVVAFNGNCPPGWIEFTDLAGRSIVGMGTYPDQTYDQNSHTWSTGGPEPFTTLGEQGGTSTWEVVFDELPEGPQLSADTVDLGAVAAEHPGGDTVFVQTLTGDPVQIGNRPPYVVLRYCEKQ